MESFRNIIEQYTSASRQYTQAINEWDRFFSSTETKEGKVDFILLKDKVSWYRDEISGILDCYIQKRQTAWEELLYILLSDPKLDIRSHLDKEALDDFGDFISQNFNNEVEEEQFNHLIRWERSKLDRDWIRQNILDNAEDQSLNPVSLFQEDKDGKMVFAPYVTLHDTRYIFDTSYDNLTHISNKIFLPRWDIKISLSHFIDRSGFKIKDLELGLLFDKKNIHIPDMRTSKKVKTFEDMDISGARKVSLNHHSLHANIDHLTTFLWFDIYDRRKQKKTNDILNPIDHILSSSRKTSFWNYMLLWFISWWYMDKYYTLNKRQQSAMYILQNYYSDQFTPLYHIFDNLTNGNIAQLDELTNQDKKSNMLSNLIIFLFELIITKLISDKSRYDVYKTLPYDDINNGIDIILYNKRSNDRNSPINFIDLKSTTTTNTRSITNQTTKKLSPMLINFLNEKLWYDIDGDYQIMYSSKNILQVPLGSSYNNYDEVMRYITLLMASPNEDDPINKKNISTYLQNIEDIFARSFARSYVSQKKKLNNTSQDILTA